MLTTFRLTLAVRSRRSRTLLIWRPVTWFSAFRKQRKPGYTLLWNTIVTYRWTGRKRFVINLIFAINTGIYKFLGSFNDFMAFAVRYRSLYTVQSLIRAINFIALIFFTPSTGLHIFLTDVQLLCGVLLPMLEKIWFLSYYFQFEYRILYSRNATRAYAIRLLVALLDRP